MLFPLPAPPFCDCFMAHLTFYLVDAAVFFESITCLLSVAAAMAAVKLMVFSWVSCCECFAAGKMLFIYACFILL